MLIPDLPPVGSEDWYAHYTALHRSVAGTPGVLLDTFTGSTDDERLTAAMSYVAAQTIKPAILLGSRQYVFTQANRQVFSGLKITNPAGFGNQQRGANSIPCDVRFNGSGVWWTKGSTSTIFDFEWSGIGAQGNSSSVFMDLGSTVLWTSTIRDVGFNLWKHVLGQPSSKLLTTACLFDGWWNVNNSRNTAFTIGGSDNNFWTDGCLLDSPPSNSAPGTFHLICDFLEKTHIGPMFITADQVGGIQVKGSSTASQLVFCGAGRCEGRNASTPSYGSSVRIDGGAVTFRDWEMHYGYANPGASGRTGEGGVISVLGGKALFDGVWYDRAAANSEEVPFIYQAGGYVRAVNVMTGTKGGTWTGKPRLKSVGGTYDIDNSLQLAA